MLSSLTTIKFIVNSKTLNIGGYKASALPIKRCCYILTLFVLVNTGKNYIIYLTGKTLVNKRCI